MSSLASWIDSEAVASLARELCPRDEEEGAGTGGGSGAWSSGGGLSRSRVAVADFPGEEEVSRARAKLESIRAQARHSGLIDHAVEVVEAEVPGRFARQDDESAGEPVDDGPCPAADESEPEVTREVIGEAKAVTGAGGGDGEGPFREKRSVGAPAGSGGVSGGGEELPAYVIPHGTLGVRMGAFADWVSEVTGGSDVFVIDSQGYPLVERGGDADLVAAALLLGDASRRAAGQVDGGDGVVRMEVGGGMVLSVLACETQYGSLCVGVHGAVPVGGAVGARLSAALRVTLGV